MTGSSLTTLTWLGVIAAMCLEDLLGGRRVRGATSEAGSLTDQMMQLTTIVVVTAGPLARLSAPALVIQPLWVPVISGLLVATAGLIIRAMAMRTLGTAYRLGLHLRDDDRLITEGPYSVVRHPGYTGLLLQLIGLQLVTASPLAVAAVILVVAVLPLRIAVEEAMLVRHFGTTYNSYRGSTVYRIVPGVY